MRNDFYTDNSIVDIGGEERWGEVEEGKGGHINRDRTILGCGSEHTMQYTDDVSQIVYLKLT